MIAMWFPSFLSWGMGATGGRRSGPMPERTARSRAGTPPLQVERLEERTLLTAGGLDPTFGHGGRVTTDVPGSGSDLAFAVAQQADGKVVMGGWVSAEFGFLGPVGFVLTRYNPEGGLDPTFGAGGVVITPLPEGGYVTSLVVQADGKVVAGGISERGAGDGV